VTRRFLKILICCFVATLIHASSFAAENSIDIEQARIETSEEGYKLSANFSFDLNRGLENAITSGVPIYFSTDVEMARPRWYWLDENAVSAKQTIRISYNVLTRQFTATILGGLQQNYRTLDEALSLVRRPPRWVVAEYGNLIVGETYLVAVRIRLDISHLPKPFQVDAINNRDWRLSSDWKRFSLKAER
jgi:hypothetical protein